MRFDPNNGTLLQDLSRRSQVLSENSSSPTVRYQLRQNVGFHDGSTLTAEDVVFSYNRARESSTWSELLNGIRGIETPDSYTVVFTLSTELASALNNVDGEPFSTLYPKLKIWTLPIVPARVYQSDRQRFITNPVGCGPFIAELNQNGKSGIVQLKAFDQYYLGTPRLPNLSIALQPDINVLSKLLVAGRLNAIVLPDPEESLLVAEQLELLEDKYLIIRTTTGTRRVVHVQDRSLRERLPNNYETNWNAHLWYL
jgi:peptide/nickel transport system substrate-binding protein